MDSANLILTEPASLLPGGIPLGTALLRNLDPAPIEAASMHPASSRSLSFAEGQLVRGKQKKEQAAKDFESVLLGKLLDEMKNSIGDWGFEEDGASKQIEGIFWLYMARHLANNGGLGLWKDIYQTLNNPDQTNKTTQSLDKNV